MNISLIYPLLSKERSTIDENKQFWPPLGLAYIASVLENKGHKVKIIDRDALLRKNKLNFDVVDEITLDAIDEMGADIVGIGGTTPTFGDVADIAKLIKKRNSKRIVVFGGPHATGEPALSLNDCAAIDIIVRGEGEFTMLDIVTGKNLSDITGISFRNNGKVISNSSSPLCPNLDDIPFPARHLLDMDFYTRPSRFTSRNLSLRTTSVFTARGCPYSCNYCAGPLMFEGKVRFHSPERVIAEINELVDLYSIEAIYFAEDMFLSNKVRAKSFMDLLINSGLNKKIRWFAQIRSNVVDDELLSLMKVAGCVHVEYGFESGSQRILDMMGKRIKVEDNLRAAKITRKSGLRFQANIIVGYPGEKEEDFHKTVDFIKKTRPSNIGFNIFMPLPGTRIYNKLKVEGRVIPSWDEIGDPEGNRAYYADMTKEKFEELYFKTRLKVILPMNLYYFLKDNLTNPLRLISISLSQFKGVITKTFHTFSKLAHIRNTYDVLYVSYNAFTDPVFQSQGISYLKGLTKTGLNFLIVTFEKQKDTISQSKKSMHDLKLDWRWLKYHKKPYLLSTLWDIFCGNIYIACLLSKNNVKMVHARGVISAAMSFLPSLLYKRKFIFDIRSSLAEAYASAGYWRKTGLVYKSVKYLEHFFVRHSDSVVVETSSHADALCKLALNKKMPPIEVIPCCVDLERFAQESDKLHRHKDVSGTRDIRLLYIGSLSGWYMIDQMLDFFTALKEIISDSRFVFLTKDSSAGMASRIYKEAVLFESIQFDSADYNELASKAIQMNAGIVFTKPFERMESMPVKIGEYLASGLPVVLNKGMGDAEKLVRQQRIGVVIEEFNKESYRKAARELLELMKEGATLESRCRGVAKEFLSLNMGIDRYDAIYKRFA